MNKKTVKKEQDVLVQKDDKVEPKFVSLMSDMTLKTLWVKGNALAKEFLNRIITTIVGIDIREYTLYSNELGLSNYKSLANKTDILLVSPDKKVKVNVELNKKYTKELINKNDSYILKVGGETYAGLTQEEKYSFSISVVQVNINGFKSRFDTEFIINEYSLSNKKTNTERMSIKIYDISLPKDSDSCYDIDEEFKKNLLMFTAKNYAEMADISKGNKERESVMKELKRLGSDPEFVDYYDHEEFEEINKKALERDAILRGLEQGLEQGIEQGLEQGQALIVKKMFDKGKTVGEISDMLDIDSTKVKKILNECKGRK